MEPIYKEAALPVTKIHKTTLFKTPPWKIITPKTQQKSHPPNNIPKKNSKKSKKNIPTTSISSLMDLNKTMRQPEKSKSKNISQEKPQFSVQRSMQ